jgi:hypothetical protein
MTFAAALNCMDGRTQLPVIDYLRRACGVDHVDMITEPGINKLLAEDSDGPVVTAVRMKLQLSIRNHRTRLAAVVGHDDCAANPCAREIQRGQILAALATVRGWNLGIRAIGLWVDENWEVSEIV